MRGLTGMLLAGALLWGPASAYAAELAGVTLADEAFVADSELTLNGLGLREKFFVDVYVGGLYLSERVTDAEQAIAMGDPKRVVLHIVYDEIEREKLVDAWNEGFEANLDDAQRQALAGQIERFNGLFETVQSGDEIAVEYVPATGTRVMLNGETKGTVEGADFAEAWLRIFIGDHPADDDLKAGMLGGS